MTAATRKSLSLDDLDRDELLQLIRGGLWLTSEKDLVWAQWEVAGKRAAALRERVIAMYDELRPLSVALDAALRALHGERDPRKVAAVLRRLRKAQAAYDAKEGQQGKLSRQAERMESRQDRLYALYQELPR